jgi:hypothetical protein
LTTARRIVRFADALRMLIIESGELRESRDVLRTNVQGRKPKSPGRDARGFVLQQLASDDQKRGPSGAPQLKR